MRVVDPGHEYSLDSYDGGESVRLVFVKREGEGYPFNAGHHPGTNCQEVIRVLIDRVKYLQKQIPCEENELIINNLRSCLWAFEGRAAKRHGRASVLPWQEKYQAIPVEEQPTCTGCGHIGCSGGEHRATAVQMVPPSTQPSARVAAEELEREDLLLSDVTPAERDEITSIIAKHCFPSAQPVGEQKCIHCDPSVVPTGPDDWCGCACHKKSSEF